MCDCQSNSTTSGSKEFMRHAIELSQTKMEAGFGGPFGAVITKDGKIIAEGYNQVTSSNDPTAHAEVTAIREACKFLESFDLSGCEIYTSCEPCPMCLSAIYWARLETIYYANSREDAADIGFDDEMLYSEISKPISERSIPTHRMLEDEAIRPFNDWKNKSDKIRY
ncbi:nucleoside deaminase [Thiomicrorhabdus hydrogeniphila]